MDQFVPQTLPCASSYVSAPTSPSGCSLDNMQFYSAPSSPMQRIGSNSFGYGSEMENTNYDVDSNSDGFEFDFSQSVVAGSEYEISRRFDYCSENKQDLVEKQPERCDSLSRMTFADELFSNGQVLPLKLPPGRVQSSNGQSSIASSPKSSSPVLRIPFARRNTWNDNFDPFKVALEKVKDEKRRTSVHRRSQSLSPFRTITATAPTTTASLEPTPQQMRLSPKNVHFAGPKGSVYTRWAHCESMGHKRASSPKGLTIKPKKGLSFRRIVKCEKVGQEAPTMTALAGSKIKTKENGEQSDQGTSKVKKMKGILIKYASFGKDKNEGKLTNQIAALWKPSYFNRLSFKFKGNGQGNGKKKVCEEPKMPVVQYKQPKLALCLGGQGMESPRI
ncbi:hypothetical protein LguiA_021550 [Lonicera macranthoides]